VIADNQLALNASWDDQKLCEQLAALQDNDFDLNLLGFDDEELALRLLAGEIGAELTEEDEVSEVPAVPVSRPGDLWLLGSKGQVAHRVLCGDATNSADTARFLCGRPHPFLMVSDRPMVSTSNQSGENRQVSIRGPDKAAELSTTIGRIGQRLGLFFPATLPTSGMQVFMPLRWLGA